VADNGKKECPSIHEEDAFSKWGKILYKWNAGSRRYWKNRLNRRFRKRGKQKLVNYDD
jgi:hypothetical protein